MCLQIYVCVYVCVCVQATGTCTGDGTQEGCEVETLLSLGLLLLVVVVVVLAPAARCLSLASAPAKLIFTLYSLSLLLVGCCCWVQFGIQFLVARTRNQNRTDRVSDLERKKVRLR